MSSQVKVALAVLPALIVATACLWSGGGSAAEGRELYRANGCATCHGPEGHGDGPVGKILKPMPRDFRDAAAFKNGTDVAAIARTVAAGLSQDGGRMPQFNHLSEEERRSIALFVISLRENSAEKGPRQ